MKGYQWLLPGAIAVFLTACSSGDHSVADMPVTPVSNNETAVRLKNGSPAEVNCTLAGGTMALSRQLNGNRIGTCQLANGKRCDESALLRGMCPAG